MTKPNSPPTRFASFLQGIYHLRDSENTLDEIDLDLVQLEIHVLRQGYPAHSNIVGILS